MSSEGIKGVYLETHNWGKTVKFFEELGYQLEFDTGHNSGQLRNGDSPYVFVAEIPPDREPGMQLVLTVPGADEFHPGAAVETVTGFEETHYGTKEMTVRDPDARP